MNRYKYLIKNVGIMTLSSFATKLLAFFLVPLYTNILSTVEYGIYDVLNITVAILYPILTVSIGDSVMRFTLDKQYNKEDVLRIGIRYLLLGNLVVASFVGINYFFSVIPILKEYSIFFFLMYFVQSASSIIIAYSRGSENIEKLSISSVISVLLTLGLNVIFLVVLKLGLKGYFLANIIGPVAQCFYLIIATKAFKGLCGLKNNIELERAMTQYSGPLIANSIAWWVNNASDRYVVILFCGLGVNGIYSVASKIPSILNIIQTIFNQAWTLSAVKDFDPEDKNGFFKTTYSLYNCILILCCSLLICSDKLLSKVIYAKEFYQAWQYVPWLTIAIVFGSLSGYLGGFFSAVKNSKTFASSTIIGAVVNIILNLIFTPIIGAMGAAIATAVCYMVVWAIRLIQSSKYIRIQIKLGRDIVAYCILIIQSIVILVFEGEFMYLCEIILFVVIMVLFREEMKLVFSKFIKAIRAFCNKILGVKDATD